MLTIDRHKAFFQTRATDSYQFRLKQLDLLKQILIDHDREIYQALKADLGKPPQEAFMTEIAPTLEEIKDAKKNLRRWMKPQRVPTPIHLQPARSFIHNEAKGVALIIAPWNYPLMLLLGPLVGAIAAGCCAVVKPSELAPHTSALMKRLISDRFANDYVSVVEGGVPETTELLKLKFDHIFFTGSTEVGRIVAKAAAENLISTTLELGGKSPAIITENADLDLTAKRIVWGKYINAGQTCVAPDYLYIAESRKPALIERIKYYIELYFGKNPKTSESYARIVNASHFKRLESLLKTSGATVGGERDESQLYFAPTLLTDSSWSDPAMQQEIFGPILPILTFKSFNEVISRFKTMDKPLAAYLFTESRLEQKKFVDEVSFGGGCINDTIVHLGNSHLPFGGIGASGVGAYHGKTGFLAFTHQKSILKKPALFDIPVRYPPFTPFKFKFLKLLFLRRLPKE